MVTLRLVHTHELKQAAALADSIFRDEEQSSMGTAFPAIFSPGQSHSYGAFVEDRLVSFMGLVPFILQVGPARLKVFSMGAVCTHPDYRGQGLAGRLLDLCKQHAEEAGASLLFISGDRSLYTRVHCYPFGRSERFALDAAGAARLAGAARNAAAAERRLRPYTPADAFAVQEAASARSVAYEQSLTELLSLLGAEAYASCAKLAHQTLVAAQEPGGVDAFAVIAAPGRYPGKSPAQAIEWAGAPEAVAALLGDAVERFSLPRLEVAVGWQERELAQLLRAAEVPAESSGNGGTVYLVNAERLTEQAAPYWAASGAPQPAIAAREDGSYELVLPGGAPVSLAPGELISLLFDPESPHSQTAPGLLPIPLPYLNGLHFI